MTPQTPAQSSDNAPLPEGQYEFRGDENISIDRVATSSAIWAVCAMVGAALLGTLAAVQFYLDNLRGAILVLPLFLVCAVAGWLYLDAGRALKQVVTTEGNDVDLLMGALNRMAKAFRNEVIATGVAIVVFAVLAFTSKM